MEEPVMERKLVVDPDLGIYTSGTKWDRPLFGYRNNGHLRNLFSAQSTYFCVGICEQ